MLIFKDKTMPEIISKYPDLAIKALNEGGGRCGEGITQHILTKCPPERFCRIKNIEVCVYGINEIHKTQQITTLTLLAQPPLYFPLVAIVVVVFVVGLFIGWKSVQTKHPPS